jgi:hypothetical protein
VLKISIIIKNEEEYLIFKMGNIVMICMIFNSCHMLLIEAPNNILRMKLAWNEPESKIFADYLSLSKAFDNSKLITDNYFT